MTIFQWTQPDLSVMNHLSMPHVQFSQGSTLLVTNHISGSKCLIFILNAFQEIALELFIFALSHFLSQVQSINIFHN